MSYWIIGKWDSKKCKHFLSIYYRNSASKVWCISVDISWYVSYRIACIAISIVSDDSRIVPALNCNYRGQSTGQRSPVDNVLAGVISSILVRSHTFVAIVLKQFLLSFPLPLNHLRRVVVSYKRKYLHEVQVNRLFKLAQEKVCMVRWTDHPTMTIALDWDKSSNTNKQKAVCWNVTWYMASQSWISTLLVKTTFMKLSYPKKLTSKVHSV